MGEANGADAALAGNGLSPELERLFDAMSDAVCVSDGNGFVAYVNPAFARRFGSIAGTSCHDHFRSLGANAPSHACSAAQDSSAGRAEWDDPVHARRYELSATIVADASASRRKVTILRDVTERRSAEAVVRAAQEAMEVASEGKRHDLRTVSHAIRTSLNGVIGYAQLLQDCLLDPMHRRWAERIDASARSLEHVVHQVIDLSQVQGADIRPILEPTSIRDLVAEVVQLFAPVGQAQQIEVAGNTAQDVPTGLLLDSMCMRQLLMALVDNATKWTHRGSVQIRIAIGACPDLRLGEVCLVVSVSDTGIGMTRALREAIAAFFRDTTPRTPPAEVGLGLLLCKRLADRIGGRLEIESEEGQGTTVRLHLGAVRASLTNPCC